MKLKGKVTFIVASNNENVLKNTFMISPTIKKRNHEIIILKDHPSASHAYNEGIIKSNNEILIFVHQDVFLPRNWFKKLQRILDTLEKVENNWGVIGCFGVNKNGLYYGHIYSNGLKSMLGEYNNTKQVRTLDEMVLIIRKSSGLRFDKNMPYFHLYGTDICLRAQSVGKKNYAINNFCIHNSLPVKRLKKDYWNCIDFLRKKWHNMLPIYTCIEEIHNSKAKMNYARIKREVEYFLFKKKITNPNRLTPNQLLDFKLNENK